MEYSVLMPLIPRRPEQILPFAALVEWTAAHRLWQGQAIQLEPFQGFASVAGAGFRVPTGLGVTLMALRHPYEAINAARTLAMVTGESVVAGFGPGALSFQVGLLGAPYRSQLGAVREYLTIARGLLNGGFVDFTGEYFSCRAQLPPTMTPPVELGLGVLRPGMAQLAGEIADSAITWLTPAVYLEETVRPALRRGADRAERPVPKLSAIVPVALERPDRDVSDFVLASNSMHMQAPHYLDMLKKAGIDIVGMEREAAGREMAERGAFVYGDLNSIFEQFDEYRKVGVDEIILNLTGVCNLYGVKAALNDLKTILAEVSARAVSKP
jgi:alkanesulfonate monooxygenase SsuD/methylene tetrahydromethanopterin reductase-like flavin-dependent oxidoreductase (luciferase family)